MSKDHIHCIDLEHQSFKVYSDQTVYRFNRLKYEKKPIYIKYDKSLYKIIISGLIPSINDNEYVFIFDIIDEKPIRYYTIYKLLGKRCYE